MRQTWKASETTSSAPSVAEMVRAALLISLGAAVGQGFGRFAYALLLNPMRSDLGWNYAQSGLINSANALGYLGGALAVGPVVARWGAPRVLRVSLLGVSLSLAGTGLLHSYLALLLLRIVAGFGAGLIFVGGAAALLQIDSSHRSDLPLSVYFAGPGIGITISGLFVPLALGAPLHWDWRAVWVAMGVLGLVALTLIEPPLRRAARTTPHTPAPAGRSLFVARDYLRLWPAMTAYAVYGLGYIGYMTFVVAFLQSMQVAPIVVQGFWVLVGVAAALTGFLWQPSLRRLTPQRTMALILLALTVGALLPILATNIWSFALSAVLFGGSFLAVVTAVTRQVRQTLPPARWTAVMGNATALFAIGQLVGPTLTGAIADRQGGLALGLLCSGALLGIATLVALLGPQPVASSPEMVRESL
jgi:predicted MFS family arabinose efflux permease